MANTKEYEALEREYRRLAKKADSRLRALEAYQHDQYFKPAIKWSYAKAQKDIDKWGGNKRFNTKPPENTTSLKAKISDIKSFLDSPTSTKRGITEVYKQRADTLNANYGTNYTWKEMATFFESEAFNNLMNKYGSKVIQRAIATIQKSAKDIFDKIEDSNDRVVRISDDAIENQVINDAISKYGLTRDMI